MKRTMLAALALGLAFLATTPAYALSIYVERTKAFADFSVYVESTKAFADCVIYKEKTKAFAKEPQHGFVEKTKACAELWPGPTAPK